MQRRPRAGRARARAASTAAACVRVAGVDHAVSAIFIDARGERMIVTYRDERLDAARPADPAALVAAVDALLADNRFPDFVRPICAAARARGIPVVLDADRPTPMADDRCSRIATHVVFSSECLRATTGLDDLGAALARIADATPCLPRRHRRPAATCSGCDGRALRRMPGLRGRGGRHARRRRRVPRRLRAGAGRGPRRGRGDALCAPRRRRSNAPGSAASPARPGRAEVEALLAADIPRPFEIEMLAHA